MKLRKNNKTCKIRYIKQKSYINDEKCFNINANDVNKYDIFKKIFNEIN